MPRKKSPRRRTCNSEGFRIEFEGRLCMTELRQAFLERINALEERGIEYVKDANLSLRFVDEHGDPIALREPDGSRPTHWKSRGYKSAASEYKL